MYPVIKTTWKGTTDMDLLINNVGKKYSEEVWGLKDFSLKLRPGVLGLLGPNGAGKSTLMNILATITRPTEGAVLWNGVDIVRQPNEVRRVLGYLPQSFGVYPNLTAQEFLEYMAAIKGLDAHTSRRRIDELLQHVNLTEVRKRPLGGYSGGMKQRIGIAQALLNDPQLLIVDEPTVGLDPEERVRFRSLIADLAGERIIILSTHIVSDVEATATHIVLANHGRLLESASPENLLQIVEGRVWEWIVSSDELVDVKKRHLVSGTLRRSNGMQLRIISDREPGAGARPVSPTFEDAYLKIISSNGRTPQMVKA